MTAFALFGHGSVHPLPLQSRNGHLAVRPGVPRVSMRATVRPGVKIAEVVLELRTARGRQTTQEIRSPGRTRTALDPIGCVSRRLRPAFLPWRSDHDRNPSVDHHSSNLSAIARAALSRGSGFVLWHKTSVRCSARESSRIWRPADTVGVLAALPVMGSFADADRLDRSNAPSAGVSKPTMHEVAERRAPAMQRALWRFDFGKQRG
jgi:hypothetical protein